MSSSNITITKVSGYRHGITFDVVGSTGKKYIVDYNFEKGWICDCPDHLFRHRLCKHMQYCIDFVKNTFGEVLPGTLWCDDPKSDIVVNGESATSHTHIGATIHTLVEEVVENGSY